MISPIPEIYVDYVVQVDRIGDPAGIVSGTTRITRDPVGLVMADYAAKVIDASGLLKDGFSFQTGAGGASLAAAKYLKDIMLREKSSRAATVWAASPAIWWICSKRRVLPSPCWTSSALIWGRCSPSGKIPPIWK